MEEIIHILPSHLHITIIFSFCMAILLILATRYYHYLQKHNISLPLEPVEREFPDEMYLQIFSFLNGKELSVAQCVSKNWMRLCDDHMLWEALCGSLGDEEGCPWKLCAHKEGISWKQRYFISSKSMNSLQRERWQEWLSLLRTNATSAAIFGNDFHVHAISPNFKIGIVELDDIFKGVGLKGSFPIPRILHIDRKSFTVLTSMHTTWTLGFWLVAMDLRNHTALVIVKTRRLVLLSIKERCHFVEQIQLVQSTLKAAEQLIGFDF